MHWDNNPRLQHYIPPQKINFVRHPEPTHKPSPNTTTKTNYQFTAQRDLISDLRNELTTLKSQFTKLIYKPNEQSKQSTPSRIISPRFSHELENENKPMDKPKLQKRYTINEKTFSHQSPIKENRPHSRQSSKLENHQHKTFIEERKPNKTVYVAEQQHIPQKFKTIQIFPKLQRQPQNVPIIKPPTQTYIQELQKEKSNNKELSEKLKKLEEQIQLQSHKFQAQINQKQERINQLLIELEKHQITIHQTTAKDQQLSKIKNEFSLLQAKESQLNSQLLKRQKANEENQAKWLNEKSILEKQHCQALSSKDEEIKELLENLSMLKEQSSEQQENDQIKAQNQKLKQKLNIYLANIDKLTLKKDQYKSELKVQELKNEDCVGMLKEKDQTIRKLVKDVKGLEKEVAEHKKIRRNLQYTLQEINNTLTEKELASLNSKYKNEQM